MKKLLTALAMVLASTQAQAGFFDDLGKINDIINKLPGGTYVCTAGAFGRNFMVEDKDQDKAKFEVERQCNAAGVSWVYCSASCKKKTR